jgi:hypothetical protein
MFGVPGQGMATLPAAFAHMAGTVPAEQMEAGAGAAAAAPAGPGEAEHPPGHGVAQVGTALLLQRSELSCSRNTLRFSY